MTTFYLTSSQTGPGTLYALTSSDTAFVGEGVTIGSTNSDAFNNAAGASMRILGLVAGATTAVRFDGSNPFASLVFVGETGHVIGGTSTAIFALQALNLTNYGEIYSAEAFALNINSGANFVNNFGSISSGDISTINASGTGTLSLVNAGVISRATNGLVIVGTSNGDTLVNTGLVRGDVDIGPGADVFDGRGGKVIGVITGNTGNDTIYGGIGADRMFGGADNDTLYFDAEDLRLGDVKGGAGYDTGYNTDETTPLTINMQAQELEGYFGSAADEIVIAGNLGGFGLFARTGAGNDLIDGTSTNDNVDGGAGVDVLYGRGGLDDLAGGNGGDWLQGGAGADTFRFNALTDSTVNGQDFIADFSTADGDKINLTNALAGLPAATFNSGFGTGTSVYVFAGGGGTSLVQVYTGATLQMQLVVNQASLAASDFVL